MQLEDRKGWFWYIPLHNDMVSIGVVASFDYLFVNRDKKDIEKIYYEEIGRCPGVQPLLANAERVAPVRAAKEYSYQASQVAGDGWVMVGDAFGFLDPLYSSGILLAFKSGALAADAICEGLAAGDVSGQRLGAWGPDYLKGMERMRRLVCEFYDGMSFGKLIMRHPHLKGTVTDLLIGDLFRDEVDAIVGPIEELRAERHATAESMG
jgi:flavin-dependent dehydrogenase